MRMICQETRANIIFCKNEILYYGVAYVNLLRLPGQDKQNSYGSQRVKSYSTNRKKDIFN